MSLGRGRIALLGLLHVDLVDNWVVLCLEIATGQPSPDFLVGVLALQLANLLAQSLIGIIVLLVGIVVRGTLLFIAVNIVPPFQRVANAAPVIEASGQLIHGWLWPLLWLRVFSFALVAGGTRSILGLSRSRLHRELILCYRVHVGEKRRCVPLLQ